MGLYMSNFLINLKLLEVRNRKGSTVTHLFIPQLFYLAYRCQDDFFFPTQFLSDCIKGVFVPLMCQYLPYIFRDRVAIWSKRIKDLGVYCVTEMIIFIKYMLIFSFWLAYTYCVHLYTVFKKL